jgi:N-acetylmuramoyl-L-alanine amidase CwlA
MLVSKQPIKKDVPHEDGHWIEFRQISHVQLEEAREIASKQQREMAKQMGAEFIKAFQDDEKEGKDPKDTAARLEAMQEANRYNPDNYDTMTLLTASIVDWSAEEQVTQGAIKLLDEPTAMWAKRMAIEVTVPKPEVAEAEGKDFAPSFGTT